MRPVPDLLDGLRAIRLSALGWLVLVPAASVGAGELHDAVRAKDNTAVEAVLASGTEVDETDFLFGTALHVAVAEGNMEIAKTLIDHGADVDAVSEQQGSHASHLAAQFGDAAMLALLLDNGANIEAHDHHQRTALHRAASAGHVDALRLLLEHGANVHAREEKYGQTPLHDASHHGHLEVVELLLNHDADIHAPDNAGRTAFRGAATAPSYSAVGDASLLEYLVAKGADPNTKDTSGLSVLANAKDQASAGDSLYPEIVDALQRLGARE